MNVSLHHVSIGVNDVAAAVEFYERLGMTVSDARPAFSFDGAWLQIGAQQLHVIKIDVPIQRGANHFALRVDDLDACVAELEAAGLSVRRTTYTPGAGRQAVVLDPSGNAVELNQPD